jgi:hypothetical protein
MTIFNIKYTFVISTSKISVNITIIYLLLSIIEHLIIEPNMIK